VTRPDGTELHVTSVASARAPTAAVLKQARTCANGHYIGNLGDAPHPGPWQFEILSDLVSRRPLKADD
jgi:hypothetical protein